MKKALSVEIECKFVKSNVIDVLRKKRKAFILKKYRSEYCYRVNLMFATSLRTLFNYFLTWRNQVEVRNQVLGTPQEIKTGLHAKWEILHKYLPTGSVKGVIFTAQVNNEQ